MVERGRELENQSVLSQSPEVPAATEISMPAHVPEHSNGPDPVDFSETAPAVSSETTLPEPTPTALVPSGPKTFSRLPEGDAADIQAKINNIFEANRTDE